jgi:hypothetical protein
LRIQALLGAHQVRRVLLDAGLHDRAALGQALGGVALA